MEFAIATVQFWQSIGFDCTDWRKSIDGTLAIVHLEYALILCPDIQSRAEATIYSAPTDELTALLVGSDWQAPKGG